MTTKAGIRSQFLSLLARNDCDNATADTFIEQALARIQRTLRVPAMERVQTVAISSTTPSVVLIPNDFLSLKYLYAGSTLLEYVDIGRFLSMPQQVGTPKCYTRIGNEFRLSPTPTADTSLVMVYHGEIPDLVLDTDTNFVSDLASDLLVYGALSFAADYFIDERKPVFEETFNRAYEELVEQALLLEMEQSGMAIRSYGDY